MKVKRRWYFGIGCTAVGFPMVAGILIWTGETFGTAKALALWVGALTSLCLLLEGTHLLVNGKSTNLLSLREEEPTKEYLEEAIELL